MKKIVCLLRDEVATTFGNPFVFESEFMAIRAFRDLLNDKDCLPGKHPADFSLYKIADYDDITAEIVPCERVVISRGSDIVFSRDSDSDLSK